MFLCNSLEWFQICDFFLLFLFCKQLGFVM